MSDVLKKFAEEKKEEDFNDIIKKINELSIAVLNGIFLFELAGSYKTRQHIRLTDGEIEEYKKDIRDDLVRWVFSLCIAEDILKKHNLWEEYESLSGRIIERVAQNNKSKQSAEKAEQEQGKKEEVESEDPPRVSFPTTNNEGEK